MTSSKPSELTQRGRIWLAALTGTARPQAGYAASVQVVDATLAGSPARYIAVVPDPDNLFPRARHGEVGLREAWDIARAVREMVRADVRSTHKRPVVAVVDVASQAYGRNEEALGIHQALAGAVDAYASARELGHPVIALLVGRAMSGAFLAHGYQANRLIALDDPQVMVHAMGKASAARITLRTVEALEALTAQVPPMAYDIGNYASLGLLWRLLKVRQADAPAPADVALVREALEAAVRDIRAEPDRRPGVALAGPHRAATCRVKALLREQW
ncbi:biotin-independent malonate decarboxylase subunit gamma [Pandoraea sp.]|uniref:biotin-independent malonate decarboxylase subunit gamma n=1 Tax=Pandoraea sp. TaxID=1883445 RepID=UPI0012096D8D|nr:biotin-independent malonate decarboxylase subunit gamma [Pandoraea sp.]TAL53286.1 MAG: biotin-independent malonate decarboxylase subunit gamma [Pandoraea sp.]TAM16653.1 MAG: biotin-independent malonate decarboxylase subunit gamma [Pandoraea sp.]